MKLWRKGRKTVLKANAYRPWSDVFLVSVVKPHSSPKTWVNINSDSRSLWYFNLNLCSYRLQLFMSPFSCTSGAERYTREILRMTPQGNLLFNTKYFGANDVIKNICDNPVSPAFIYNESFDLFTFTMLMFYSFIGFTLSLIQKPIEDQQTTVWCLFSLPICL